MFVQLSHHITLITVQFTCIWPGCTLLQYAHCEQVRLNECSGGNAGGFTRIDSKDTIINKSLNATQDSGGDSKERKKAAGKELMPFGKGKGEFFFFTVTTLLSIQELPSLPRTTKLIQTHIHVQGTKKLKFAPPPQFLKKGEKGIHPMAELLWQSRPSWMTPWAMLA